MPRKSKQPNATAPGQAYGVAGDQKAAMSQIPLPEGGPFDQQPTQVAQPPSSLPGMPEPSPAPPMLPTPEQAALQAALGMEPPDPNGSLFAETARPNEDIRTGIVNAPDQLPPRRMSNTVMAMNIMAEAYGGDPALEDAAVRAAMKGL